MSSAQGPAHSAHAEFGPGSREALMRLAAISQVKNAATHELLFAYKAAPPASVEATKRHGAARNALDAAREPSSGKTPEDRAQLEAEMEAAAAAVEAAGGGAVIAAWRHLDRISAAEEEARASAATAFAAAAFAQTLRKPAPK